MVESEQRELFRRWPSGVSVVVAEAGGRRAGLTVSSLVSLSLDLLRLERDTAVRLRNEGKINDEVLRNLERELDLTETRLAHPASG